jgi:hypothetical protein
MAPIEEITVTDAVAGSVIWRDTTSASVVRSGIFADVRQPPGSDTV